MLLVLLATILANDTNKLILTEYCNKDVKQWTLTFTKKGCSWQTENYDPLPLPKVSSRRLLASGEVPPRAVLVLTTLLQNKKLSTTLGNPSTHTYVIKRGDNQYKLYGVPERQPGQSVTDNIMAHLLHSNPETIPTV